MIPFVRLRCGWMRVRTFNKSDAIFYAARRMRPNLTALFNQRGNVVARIAGWKALHPRIRPQDVPAYLSIIAQSP